MLFFIEENLSIDFLKKQIFLERNELGSVQLIFMKNYVKFCKKIACIFTRDILGGYLFWYMFRLTNILKTKIKVSEPMNK